MLQCNHPFYPSGFAEVIVRSVEPRFLNFPFLNSALI
jgi:hypothetical protein